MPNTTHLDEEVRKKLVLLGNKRYFYLVLTLRDMLAKGTNPSITQLINTFNDRYAKHYADTEIHGGVTESTLKKNISHLIDEGIIKAKPVTRSKYSKKVLDLDDELLAGIEHKIMNAVADKFVVQTNLDDEIVIGISVLITVFVAGMGISVLMDGLYLIELTIVTLCWIFSLITVILLILARIRSYELDEVSIEFPLKIGRLEDFLRRIF
ncbi:MAG: hypothetical protein QMC85_02670 [Methanocellales archaeon]|nr:hypothetical protein [Methanocellales archaeon]